MKKRLLFIFLALVIGYYLIGFPLTLAGIAKEWPLFPGGVSLKFEGNSNSNYDGEIVLADNDGPYLFYKGDSLEVIHITVRDSNSFPTVHSYHKKERELIPIECNFKDHPEWNFKTYVKDTLTQESTYYSGVKRTMVISDIEGNFGSFRELLIANGVMNSSYDWTFSEGHLVLLGDFFDRGLNVTECLWLIYHLEGEALKKGGRVHFILGNHEIMNMTDDFRYVRRRYIANADLIGRQYGELYKPTTELGKWLSTKNIAEKINETIFVHGGISESVLKMNISLEEINALARPYYFTSKANLPQDNQNLPKLFDNEDSPFWNRDYVNQTIDESFIDQILKNFEAQEIVVGHTIVDSIKTLYSGKVIAVDTQHTESNSFGLLIEDEKYFTVDRKGRRSQIK